MCLIVASQAGKMASDELLENSFNDNKDGWGLVYHDGERPQVRRGFKFAAMLRACDIAKGHPYILHTRWATHGTVSVENNHPFEIAPYTWMAHNGIIRSVDIKDKSKSDTWHFAKEIKETLAILPEGEAAAWMYSDEFIEALEKRISWSNKLAIMLPDGTIRIAHELQGETEGEIWYSNTNSHPKTHTANTESAINSNEYFRKAWKYHKYATDDYSVGFGTSFRDDRYTTQAWENSKKSLPRFQPDSLQELTLVSGGESSETSSVNLQETSEAWLQVSEIQKELRDVNEQLDTFQRIPVKERSESDTEYIEYLHEWREEQIERLAELYANLWGVDASIDYFDQCNGQILGNIKTCQDLVDELASLQEVEDVDEVEFTAEETEDTHIDTTEELEAANLAEYYEKWEQNQAYGHA